MAAATATATSSAVHSPSSETTIPLQPLIARGWHFRDTDRLKELLIAAQLSVDSIESELLLNMDLRSIGGKSLPEPSLLRKTSHLRGPIVLQVSSSRDISRSSIDAAGNSGNKRLLQLKLTDGHSEITAVELSHVPSIPEDISPGTKVRLQGKADIHNGILCLNKKVITILGGVVQSLYEEWNLKRKYFDVPRNTLRFSQENLSVCPPPFEKLQIQSPVQGTASISHASATKAMHFPSDPTGFSQNRGQNLAPKGECSSNMGRPVQLQKNNETTDTVTDDIKLPQAVGEGMEKPTCSSERPTVPASVPVQNQVAAQKLLQKKGQPNLFNRNPRGQRQRGKFREEESSLLTLDEWERRKTATNLATTHEHSNISQDEDLARQLQQQFDLEDVHAQSGPHATEAKDITMNMFNFDRGDGRAVGGSDFRGRGRGRGRGRRGRDR